MCYIEQRFEQLAMEKPTGNQLVTKWKNDKDIYTGYTATTVFDFQHFSMHDKSHSIRILQNIELLLGRSRVDLLGVGDLWLLLQVAYFHDIGMSLTSKDMDKLWESDSKFREFLREQLKEGRYKDNVELYDAIDYYRKVDQVLNKKSDFEAVWKSDPELPTEDWPIRLVQNVQYIITEYVRKHHARRSEDYFERIFQDDKNFAEGVVERRLYELVGTISCIHTKDFNAVLNELLYEEVAIGDEHIHPRFAAAMLRIGDLLDMDNNRFNLRVLEHRGPLPSKSAAHLHKHKALKNFEITQTSIKAVSRSEDFTACLEARTWYNWIDSEVAQLIRSWNRIVPQALKGCHLEDCSLKVYLGKTEFTSKNLNHFNFDSRKMQKLLIGDSIYDCRLDCLREYVQNAIDATKVCLWKKLKENGFDSPVKWRGQLKELLPCDLKEDVILGLPIEIAFSYEKGSTGLTSDRIRIEIQDRGIGMDTACVEGITTIGKGWRAREEYQDIFESAPSWLQPTGGFGIGIQSAFMITDEVCYMTRSEKENTGHRVRLISPECSGRVTQENFDYPRAHGTTVEFCVQAMKFMNYEDLGLSEEFLSKFKRKYESTEQKLLNMFNQTTILAHAIAICKEYLAEQIPNAIFPVYIGKKGTQLGRVTSPYLYEGDGKEEKARQPLKMMEFQEELVEAQVGSKRFRWLYHIDIGMEHDSEDGRRKEKISRVILWNSKYMDCVCLSFPTNAIDTGPGLARPSAAERVRFAFKNIAVPKEQQDIRCCRIFLDIMGERAENCLQVSRSQMKSDFRDQLDKRLQEYFNFGMDKLITAYMETKKLEQEWKVQAQKREKGRAAFLVDSDSIEAGWDFGRMIFFCFTYLPLDENQPWLAALKGIHKFGLAMLDDVRRLKFVQEDSKAEEEEQEQEEEETPHNMVEYFLEQNLTKDPPHSSIFFCMDGAPPLTLSDIHRIPLRKSGSGVSDDDLYDALEGILKRPIAASQETLTFREREEYCGTVYSYLIQNREPVFSNIWGDIIFGSNTGVWKCERTAVLEERRSWSLQNNKESAFLKQLTVYFSEADHPKGMEHPPASRQAQEIYEAGDTLYKKYPVPVSHIPFQQEKRKGDGVVISPIHDTLIDQLVEIKDAHPVNEEDAIKKLLKKNENFCALVDWVYRFQVPVHHQKYHTKAEIFGIYFQWVWDHYNEL